MPLLFRNPATTIASSLLSTILAVPHSPSSCFSSPIRILLASCSDMIPAAAAFAHLEVSQWRSTASGNRGRVESFEGIRRDLPARVPVAAYLGEAAEPRLPPEMRDDESAGGELAPVSSG